MQMYTVSIQLYITGKAIYMSLQMLVAILRLITKIEKGNVYSFIGGYRSRILHT